MAKADLPRSLSFLSLVQMRVDQSVSLMVENLHVCVRAYVCACVCLRQL